MNLLFEATMPADERAAWWAALVAALPADRWIDGELADDAARARADVAIVANPAPGRLAASPRLQLVQSLWAGVDKLLADATLPADVPLARMVDPAMSAAMAETACWAALSLLRGFLDYVDLQREGRWQQRPQAQRRADETPVLVLGLGEMGRACAARLVSLGFPVRGWSRTPSSAPLPGVATCHGWARLDEALQAAAIVVNLLPLTPDTRGLLDARRLSRLPAGAGLVNLARGAHVVEVDLLAALDDGRLARAVLDVFATEPLPAGHPFWTHPRVTVLPHVAALTDLRSATAVVAANVERVRRGQAPSHQVQRARGY